jgi:hypothetical protein
MDNLALSTGSLSETGPHRWAVERNMRGMIYGDVREVTRVQVSSRRLTDLSVWSVSRCANVDAARFRSSVRHLERTAYDQTPGCGQHL